MITITAQIDDELHGLLVRHAEQRRCSMSQVIKDQLVGLLLGGPRPLPPASTALSELRRRPDAAVLTLAAAKRLARKGGAK